MSRTLPPRNDKNQVDLSWHKIAIRYMMAAAALLTALASLLAVVLK